MHWMCLPKMHTLWFPLKGDWLEWLTKVAAGMVFSGFQGVVLVTKFYDIVTSAASATVLFFFSFLLKQQSLHVGATVWCLWRYKVRMWKRSIVHWNDEEPAHVVLTQHITFLNRIVSNHVTTVVFSPNIQYEDIKQHVDYKDKSQL